MDRDLHEIGEILTRYYAPSNPYLDLYALRIFKIKMKRITHKNRLNRLTEIDRRRLRELQHKLPVYSIDDDKNKYYIDMLYNKLCVIMYELE